MPTEPAPDEFQSEIEGGIKLILANRSLGTGGYNTVVKDSFRLMQLALKELVRRYRHRLDSAAQLKFDQKEIEKGKGKKAYTAFTGGELVGLIHESEFFQALGRATGLDVSRADVTKLFEIAKLRNDAEHDTYHATAGQADVVYGTLQIYLELLGYRTPEPDPIAGTCNLLPADVYHLSDAARKSILSALLTCPQVKDEEGRNRVVAQLPASIKLLIYRRPRRDADIEAIFDALTRYHGGILFLVAALRSHELSNVLKRLNTYLARPTQWDDALERIAALEPGLPPGPAALARVWPAYRDRCSLYIDALTQQDLAAFPLHAAVEDLSNRTSTRNRPSPLDEFAQALQAAEPGADSADRFLIQVEIDFPLNEEGNDRQYRLRRLQLPAPDAAPSAQPTYVDHIDSDRMPASQLQSMLARDLGELIHRTRHAHISDIEVEILLPNALMHLPVETWLIRYINEHTPLGRLLPVAVRSLERFAAIRSASIRSGRTQRNPLDTYEVTLWETRSKLLSERTPHGASWYGDSSIRGENVSADLRLDRSIVCLGFGFPVCKRPDLMTTCVGYGVPSAVWVREEIADETQIQRLKEQLPPAVNPMELPQRIWSLRNERAGDAPPHADCCIAVLWDLPGRAAEDIAPHPLQSPAGAS